MYTAFLYCSATPCTYILFQNYNVCWLFKIPNIERIIYCSNSGTVPSTQGLAYLFIEKNASLLAQSLLFLASADPLNLKILRSHVQNSQTWSRPIGHNTCIPSSVPIISYLSRWANYDDIFLSFHDRHSFSIAYTSIPKNNEYLCLARTGHEAWIG